MYCPTGEMIADFFSKPQQGKMREASFLYLSPHQSRTGAC
jgi:hypothetical protein